jgi:hypothetical protein
MLNIMPGQRWISTAEPELGLGTILRADLRQSDIIFTGCGELKHFTHAASPLLRVRFEPGDCIFLESTARCVDAVSEDDDGLLTYHFGNETRHEGSIDPEQMHLPVSLRLRVGQCDAAHLFELRRCALQAEHLDQDRFELFAIALLSHFGCQLSPLPEHLFLLDCSNTALDSALVCDTPCCFGNIDDAQAQQVIHARHPLIQSAIQIFLGSRAGTAAFLIDDALPARSAVLETVFRNRNGSVTDLALDVRGNRLSAYTPSEQAVFRARDNRVDMKPYMRSLAQSYPALLEASMTLATQCDAGKLEALRLVVGSEFALFGKKSR